MPIIATQLKTFLINLKVDLLELDFDDESLVDSDQSFIYVYVFRSWR